jgi:UDPglucose--hexose-1-phosphate uridylyltransferase
MNTDLQNYSHRRFNILTNEWVLVSPHRTERPWKGKEENFDPEKKDQYVADCYLCAGNLRANGEKNPDYKDVFVFRNDFAALGKSQKTFSVDDGLIQAKSEAGICKVVCFSHDHSKSLADLKVSKIEEVINVLQNEFKSLGSKKDINYVQIFENKGAIMGCSNPHPHGQIWSQASLPNEVVKKDCSQLDYFKKHKKVLLKTYLDQELQKEERIIFQNNDFVVLIPFWAVWPYETMIIPKRKSPDISELSYMERFAFAESISKLTKMYDALFDCSFPYSSGIHQAPTNGKKNEYWQWHMVFYPPLLRSATIKKFMVGYEMFGSPQRDLTPEKAAKNLRKFMI